MVYRARGGGRRRERRTPCSDFLVERRGGGGERRNTAGLEEMGGGGGGGGLENRFCRRISKDWKGSRLESKGWKGVGAGVVAVNYLYQSLEIHSSKRGRFYRLTWLRATVEARIKDVFDLPEIEATGRGYFFPLCFFFLNPFISISKVVGS